MATARDIISAALRRIGYLDPGERLTAEDARTALAAMNRMMSAWAAKGLSYAHTTLPTVNATFPLAAKHEKGVIDLLAVELTDEFAPEALTPVLARAAAYGWAGLCGQYFLVPVSKNDAPSDYCVLPIIEQGEEEEA